jgi:hypothetical protein
MTNITPKTRDNIRKILVNTGDQDLIEKKMIEVLKTKIKYTKKNLTLLKMTKLRQLKVGTTLVETIANKIENNNEVRCEKTVMFVMERQIEKINAEIKTMKAEMFRVTKDGMKGVRMEWRRIRMEAVFNEETVMVWETGKVKVMKTVEMMKKKYRITKIDEMTGTCRGVKISEDMNENELETERMKEKVVVEGAEVNSDEEAYLRVPNKMADNCPFNKVKAMTDVQVMMTKVRMSMRKEKEDKESGMTKEELNNVKEIEMNARQVMNMSEGTMDFSKKRVTDMKTCRRITLPAPLEGDIEVKLKTLEGGLEAAILREEKRVKALEKNETQLTDKEARGHKSIKEREKRGEIVLLSCDKSGKSAVVGEEPFIEKMNVHMNQDPVVSIKEVVKEEKIMSGMSCQIARVLRLGEGWKHQERVQQAVRSEHTGVPHLDGMLKDHKETPQLPVRPVCRSSTSPNGILSDLTSDILVGIIREMTDRKETEDRRIAGEDITSDLGEVKSTEELLAKVMECNRYIMKREIEEKDKGNEAPQYVVGSNDVKALYPSCLAKPSAKVVREQIEKSKTDIIVNEEELALFLASTMTQEQIDNEGIRKYIHRRKNIEGGRPGPTSKCITGSEAERKTAIKQMWRKPRYKPDKEDKRKMVAIMVEIAVIKVMKTHFYKFKDTIRRQYDGGSIGLRLTGEVAEMRMLDWDIKAREKIRSAGAEEAMYARYVDDVDHVYRVLADGSIYNTTTGKIEIDAGKTITDRDRDKDLITFEVIRDIINTIDPDIQMTGDVPSQNKSRRVPVLDTEMFMKENRIMFSFYSKPMATNYVIPDRSAHPKKVKRTTLIQEGVRRLLNVSPDLPDQERIDVMEAFDLKMRYSGYVRKYRWNIIESAFAIYETKVSEDQNGIRPLYRHREFKREEREKKKARSRETWYQGEENAPNMAPLIVDPTPNGTMYNEMLQVCKEFKATHKIGIKVVQRGGQKLSRAIKSNPLGSAGCLREKCSVCKGKKKGKCDKPGIGYRQTCMDCEEIGKSATYEGESSRTAFQRGAEHDRELEKKSEDSPLWKHSSIHHPEGVARFQMEVTGTHKSVVERMCDEIVRIKVSNSKIILNSKNDWNQPALVRVVAVTGNSQETQQGDDQPTRQERRSARDTPTRRRRRVANERAASPTTPTRVVRRTGDQQQGDRELRRQRRGT